MSLIKRIRRSPLTVWRAARGDRSRFESEIAKEVRDELGFYLEMRTRELVESGVPPDEARRRAEEAFGSIETIDAECRRLTGRQRRRTTREQVFDSLVRDVIAGARALRRQPLMTIAAILILACGFGVTSVVHGLVDALLLRSLPVEDPGRLVAAFNYAQEAGFYSSVPYPDYLDYRSNTETLDDLVGYSDNEVTLAGGDERPIVTVAHVVTGNYFAALGIQPAVGRFFGHQGPAVQGELEPVVVIGHAMWQQRFGADPDIVGRTITVNGVSVTIVGVAPRGFRGLQTEAIADLWMPISLYADLIPEFAEYLYNSRGSHWLAVVGRLAPGASLEEARAEMTVLSAQQAEAYPDTNEDYRIEVFRAGSGVVWPQRRGNLVLLSSTLTFGVALLLLIACANVANLLLVRATGRRAEFGVRLALGASRGRLIRQLLTESLMLAAASGAVGILLAVWIRAGLATTIVPANLYHLLEAGIDARTVGFTATLALLTGTAFGLAPALRASNPDVMSTLKGGEGKQSGGSRKATLRNSLVVAQIGLSLPLLVGAALVGQSLWNQVNVDVGVATDNLLLVTVDPGSGGYNETEGMVIYDALLDRVASMPGVTAASYAKVVPLGRSRQATDVAIPGYEPPDPENRPNVELNFVSTGYPATAGVTMLRGRDFSAQDAAPGAPGVIVNEAMAETYWPGEDPLGKSVELSWFGGPISASVIGVLSDHDYGRIRDGDLQLRGELPRIYLSLSHVYQTSMTLLVRTDRNASALTAPVVEAMRALAPAMPDVEVISFRGHVARLLPQTRMVAVLLIVASFIGLLLAAVGIYAVMAYSVTQRTHEMGIRRALGAQRSDVLRLVLGEGLKLTFAGIVLGGLGALAATRLLTSMLYGIGSTDPASYLGVAAVLVGVALLAGYLPGRAAANSDPLPALRRE